MTHYKYKFPTLESLAQVGSTPHAYDSNVNHSLYRVRENTHWFCADRPVYEWSDIAKHLRSPLFEPGVSRIQRLATKFEAPTPTSRRRRPCPSDYGDELIMDRVWQGDLERAWRRTKRDVSFGPSRILLVIDACTPGSTSSESLAARGAAVLALADRLYSANYTVQIVAACESKHFLTSDPTARYTAEVMLLEAGQVLDIHKLASLVASGLLLRGVLMDHCVRVATSKVDEGCGTAEPLQSDSYDASGFDFVAVCKNGEVKDEYSAEQWLKKQLEALQGKQG